MIKIMIKTQMIKIKADDEHDKTSDNYEHE